MKEKKVSQSRIVAAIIDQIIVSVISGMIGFVTGIVYWYLNPNNSIIEYMNSPIITFII